VELILVNYLLNYSIIWNAEDNLNRPKRATLFAGMALVTNRKDISDNNFLGNAKNNVVSIRTVRSTNRCVSIRMVRLAVRIDADLFVRRVK